MTAASWQIAYEQGYAALDAREHKRARDIFHAELEKTDDPKATGPLLLGFAETLFQAGEFETALEAAVDAAQAIRDAYGTKHSLMLDCWETTARIQRDGVGDFAAAAASDSHAQTLRNEIVEAWRMRDDGVLVHIDSGMLFPDLIIGFGRTAANVYDRAGRSVGVTFLRPDNDVPVSITFFVYRYDGHTLGDLIEALTDRFVQDNPTADPAEEGDHTLTVVGNLVPGRLRIWRYRDEIGPAIEHLLLFRFGDVFVECRAQYRPVVRIGARAALERVLHEVGWPVEDDARGTPA